MRLLRLEVRRSGVLMSEYLIAFRGFFIFGFCMVMMIPIPKFLFDISHCVCHGRILGSRVF